MSDEIAEMEAALAAEAQLQSSIGFMDLFCNPIDRRRTTIAVLGLTTQAASGAMFLICKAYQLLALFRRFHQV